MKAKKKNHLHKKIHHIKKKIIAKRKSISLFTFGAILLFTIPFFNIQFGGKGTKAPTAIKTNNNNNNNNSKNNNNNGNNNNNNNNNDNDYNNVQLTCKQCGKNKGNALCFDPGNKKAYCANSTMAYQAVKQDISCVQCNTTNTKQTTLALTMQNNSNESGTATLTENNGQVTVKIKMVGYPMDGVPQPAHIHMGSCPTTGAIVYPLTNVVNGNSTTVINATLAQLAGQMPLAINVHQSAANLGNVLSCGNVTVPNTVAQTNTYPQTTTTTTTNVMVTFQSVNNLGETGMAMLSEANGQTTVKLTMAGFPQDGVPQPAHIHMGSCPTTGAIVYPLTDVTNGTSTTVINATIAQLKQQMPLAINVHQSAANLANVFSCGNITIP